MEVEWSHGDGGHEDNLGLAPLLARQVQNILVFANSAVPSGSEHDVDDCLRELRNEVYEPSEPPSECTNLIGDDIPSFFYPVTTDKIIFSYQFFHNTGLRLKENNRTGVNPEMYGYYDLATVAKEIIVGDGKNDRKGRNLSCRSYTWTPGFPDPDQDTFGSAEDAETASKIARMRSYEPMI